MKHVQPSGTPSSRVCSLWAAESVYYPGMTWSRNLLLLQDLNYNSQSGYCCQGFCNATDTAFVPHVTTKLLKPLHLEFMGNITGATEQRSLSWLKQAERWPGAERGISGSQSAAGRANRQSCPLPYSQLPQQGHIALCWGGHQGHRSIQTLPVTLGKGEISLKIKNKK